MLACVNAVGYDLYRDAVRREIWGKVDHVVIVAVGTEITDRNVPMIPHTAEEDIFAIIKAAGETLCSYAIFQFRNNDIPRHGKLHP